MSEQLVLLRSPVVFSRLQGNEPEAATVRAYLADMAHNPVPGSVFDEKTKRLRGTYPGDSLLNVLATFGYDALVWLDDKGVAACTAFVLENGEAKLFRVEVREDLRGNGLGTAAVAQLAVYAKRTACLPRLQVGDGNDLVVRRIYRKILATPELIPFPFEKHGKWGLAFLS